MLARIYSCAVIGIEGVIVEVEVDYSNGLPAVIIVGLPDAAVQESRERVQTAVKNAGLNFPRHRVVVNLAPAAVRKEGPAYDLRKTRSSSVSFHWMGWSAIRVVSCPWLPQPALMDSSGCSCPKWTRLKPP